MKNSWIFFVACILHGGTVVAQNKPSPVRPMLSIGTELAFPTGTFGSLFSVGVGASGRLEVPFTRSVYGMLTGGFVSFFAKNERFGTRVEMDNKSYIPLKAGARYYFSRNFYGQGEAGVSVGIQKNSGNSFAWGPGIGFLLPLSERTSLDAGVRTESWLRGGGDMDQVAIRVAYQF